MEKEKLAEIKGRLSRLWMQISQKFEEKKRRDSNEIEVLILIVAITKVKKTRIVNRVRLNNTMVDKYLLNLQQADLISHDEEAKTYTTTDKGIQFLKEFSEAIDIRWGFKYPRI